MKKRCQLSWALCLWASASVFAADLFWEGTNATWSVGGGGWKLADGTPTLFQDGDNVTFGEAPDAQTVTVEGVFTVGDVVFDATNQYTVKSKSRSSNGSSASINGCITSMQSFEKRGTGVLQFNNFGGSWTCDMFFKEGAFWQMNQIMYPPFSYTNSVFGDLSVPHTVTFGTGDTTNRVSVSLNGGGQYGYVASDFRSSSETYALAMPNQIPRVTMVLDAAKFDGGAYVVLGPLVLRNQPSTTGSNVHQSGLTLNDDVRVARRLDNLPSAKVEISSAGQGAKYYGAGEKQPITFYVEEITSEDPLVNDGVIDAKLSVSVGDSTKKGFQTKSAWVKMGPGTLEVSQAFSGYSGKIEIREGTVETKNWSTRGETMSKVIEVHEQGTLQVNGGAGADTLANTLTIVSNGTLRISAFVSIGNLQFIGAPTFYGSGSWAHQSSGQIRLHEWVGFDLTQPMVFNANGSGTQLDNFRDRTSEEVLVDADTGTYKTFTYGFTEFNVLAFTNDYAKTSEVTVNAALNDTRRSPNHVLENRTAYSGLKKTGDGILVLTRGSSYLYKTDVQAGGLYLRKPANNVNPSTGEAETVVRAGATIGGNGTVKGDLVIEEGGGFLVDGTNVTARLTVNAGMTLPNEGLLSVFNYDGTLEDVATTLTGIPLPNVVGETEGALVAENWGVRLKGYSAKECKKHLKVTQELDGTLTVRYKTGDGAILLVK